MSHPFEEPDPGTMSTSGDRFSAEQAQNRRLVVVPVEFVPNVRTARGDEVPAIRINVVDLQGQNGPVAYRGALWFGNRLINALRGKIGSLLVGYVAKNKVSGGFQAWEFTSLTQDPATVQLAQGWLQANPGFMEESKQDIQFAESMTNRAQGDPWSDVNRGGGQSAVPQLPPLGQIPGTAPGPAPLPPVQQEPQGPTPQPHREHMQGPPVQPTSPAPQQEPPPPVGGSVMDRLRAQAEAKETPEETQKFPF